MIQLMVSGGLLKSEEKPEISVWNQTDPECCDITPSWRETANEIFIWLGSWHRVNKASKSS